MKTCETCKHWKRARSGEDEIDPAFGQCAAIELGFAPRIYEHSAEDGEQTWPHVGMWERDRRLIKTTEALAEDGEGYRARLITGKDFGCTLHEAKP